MLRKYKVGKKIKLKWQLLINGRAPRYEDELTLTMTSPHFQVTELDYLIENDYIVADIEPQYHLGDYTFTLSNTDICVDCTPFEIVRDNADETDCVCSSSVSVGVTGASAFEVWQNYQKKFDDRKYSEDEFFEALRGYSAFEVWQQDFPGKTLADYYVWLGKNSGYEAWLSLPENEDKSVRDFINEIHKVERKDFFSVADIFRSHGWPIPNDEDEQPKTFKEKYFKSDGEYNDFIKQRDEHCTLIHEDEYEQLMNGDVTLKEIRIKRKLEAEIK